MPGNFNENSCRERPDPAALLPLLRSVRFDRKSLSGVVKLLFFAVAQFLPIRFVSGVGAYFGERHAVLGLAANRLWVQRLHCNLDRYGIASPPAQREQRIVAFMHRVGRIHSELLVASRMVAQGDIEIVGQENLERLNGPTIIVSCHLSNWEFVSGIALNSPTCVLYEPPADPFDHFIACRTRLARTRNWEFIPSAGNAMRRIARALADRKNVVIFADEEKNGYIWSPRLGRDIPCEGNRWFAARLAVRYGAQILPVYVQTKGVASYRVVIEPPVEPFISGIPNDDARRLADFIDDRLNVWVSSNIEYWFYLPFFDSRVDPPRYTS